MAHKEYPTYEVGELMQHKGVQEELIEDVLLESSQAIVYAPTGFTKTFVVSDMVCHVALGRDYNGKKVNQANVLYVAAEGGREVEKRMVAWETYYGLSLRGKLKLVDLQLQLHDEKDMRFVKDWLKANSGGLVVFDTAERVSVGTDENSPTQVNQRVNAPLEAIKQETGATTLLVHHQSADWKNPHPRGCTAWATPNDTIMRVKATFENTRNRDMPTLSVLQIEKQRGAQPFALKFKPIQVPAYDGNTTLLMLPDGAAERVTRKQTQPKQTKKLSHLEKLVTLLDERGDLTNQEVADTLYKGKLSVAKPILSRCKGKSHNDKIVVNEGGKWGVRPKLALVG